jgi:DNA-binding beta-propeller fold protein YncE
MKKLFFSKTVSLLIISILLLSFLPAGTVISDETFSPQGNVLCGKIEPGELLYPQGIFVDKTGNIFVVDQGNCRVQVFDKSRKFIRTFGGKDYLYMPSDIAILPNNNVIVLDSYNQATTGSGMAIFSQDGNFIKKINFFGENSSNSFNAPSGISVDSKGNIYISDTGSNRILIFDKDLKFLKEFGSNELNSPTGIAVDDSKVYVSNFGNRRISIFSKDTNKLVGSIDKFTVKRNVGFFIYNNSQSNGYIDRQ